MTDQNYRELALLDKEMRAAGQQFDIFAFPCTQFKNQEPALNSEIADFARGKYSVQFPLFAKTDVNGPSQHPVFAELKAALAEMDPEAGGRDIEWNFVRLQAVRCALDVLGSSNRCTLCGV